MGKSLSEGTLERLSTFVSEQMGLFFPKQRFSDLERGLTLAARDLRFPDAESCAGAIMACPLTQHQIEVLAGHLTVQETYFFREPKTLQVTQEVILPELLRERRGKDQRLRIWSAGCSSGEEAYTLAIMLHRMIPDLKDWNITILGTDINPHALQKALAGVYGTWSFRGTPSWLKDLYFKELPSGRFEIVPKVRHMVTFAYLNLARDSYPSLATNTNAMDLVFCRNVLMYFEPQLVRQVAEKLHNCLVEGGWLVVSPTETSQVAFGRFQSVSFPDATLYRKGAAPAPAPPEAAAPPYFPLIPPAPEAAPPPPSAPVAVNVAETLAAAQAHYGAGRYSETIAALLAIAGREDTPLKALSLLVRSYANQGELDQALSWCDRALSRHKLAPELHYLRAVILQEQDNVTDARNSLKRALYLDPNMVLAHFALGNIALNEGGGKEGKHFANALSVLGGLPPDAPLPESEGMTAARLTEVIRSMMGR